MQTKTLLKHDVRHLAVVMDKGDEVVACLQDVARREGLSGAQVQGIGAVQSATLAYFNKETKEYEPIEIDEQVEIASLLGNLSLQNGEPRVHVHAVLSRPDGSCIGGHLLEAEAWPAVEIMIVEANTALQRVEDEESGLPLLRLP